MVKKKKIYIYIYIERKFTKIYPAKLLQQGDLYAGVENTQKKIRNKTT